MTDAILQHVLADLRPSILSKLKAEADIVLGAGSSSKKATVDTHRGDTYQFCYFIRKTEPHSVVVKSRNFRAVQSNPAPPRKPSNDKKSKRKNIPRDSSATTPRRKRPRTRDPDASAEGSHEIQEDAIVVDEDEEDPGLRVPGADDDSNEADMNLDIEVEEDKPKPVLTIKYQGFSIYGHCLCIVVEPWPVVRTMTAAAAALSRVTPAASKATQSQAEKNISQQQQPLFLPDDQEDEVELVDTDGRNAGQYVNKSYLDQILNEGDGSGDEDSGGMMEFSQVLRSIGDSRAGAMNDDEDMDGSVLFGDADEYREL